MNKVLFIGSHLSKAKATKSMSEKLQELLSPAIKGKLVSKVENKLLRLVDVIVSALFGRYDIIYIDVYSGLAQIYAVVAFTIAKIRRKRVIITLHGGRLSEFYVRNPYLLNYMFKLSDLVTTPSKYLESYFLKVCSEIVYVPNFVNLKKFPYKFFKPIHPKLLWVRAFDKYYDPNLAIFVLAILKPRYPELTLTMIGPDKGTLNNTIKLIKKNKLCNAVDIIGPVPNDELTGYFHSHSVFINTPLYESFGVCVLEAASSGIPIVSTDAGEIPYLWDHDKEAIIVPRSNPEMMADAVSTILDNDNLGKAFSERANVKASQFNGDVIRTKWLTLIKGLN